MELSVVIPAYNEGLVAQANLEKVDQYLQVLGIECEIIVVNDGSTDNTLQSVNNVKSQRLVTVSYAKNGGKGFAVNRGMGIARGRYRLFMDMDLSTELSEIPKFIEHMNEGQCDICVGNRHHLGLFAQKRPWYRAMFGKVFATLSSISAGYALQDFTCGFKMFSAPACEQVFKRQSIFDWSFDTELVAIARQENLRIHELPVEWTHHSNSKVSLGPAIVTSFKGLFRIWAQHR